MKNHYSIFAVLSVDKIFRLNANKIMKAIRIHEFGASKNLRVDEIEKPTPGADLIIEMVGGEIGRQNLKCLAAGGTMTVYGAASGEDFQVSALSLLGKMQTVKGYNLNLETRENMAAFTKELMSHIAENRLEVIVNKFPLAQAQAAHDALEGRKTMGKVVLTTDSNG